MSVVVAIKKNNQVILAADSQHTFGSSKPGDGNMQESKIRPIGDAYLAGTSWALYDNILDDFLAEKGTVALQTKQEVFAFFKELWKALHDQYSFVNDQCDDKETPFGDLDASFLVVTRQRIFYISSDMCVTEFAKYHAIGSGSDFSIGALHVLYPQDLDLADMATQAVETAIAHNIYCGAPVDIVRVE